jgi:UDP-N-acetylglucosamine 2-epimerase (hydrolysing)
MFHPVTTEVKKIKEYALNFVNALIKDSNNYVVIYPNNDLGSESIIESFRELVVHSRFKVFPSIRFEYFLTLLKNSQFIIGNSSAGIREAPYYGIPVINIGTRQKNRVLNSDIINVGYSENEIFQSLKEIRSHKVVPEIINFGQGNSAQLFLDSLDDKRLWKINHQKQFRDKT